MHSDKRLDLSRRQSSETENPRTTLTHLRTHSCQLEQTTRLVPPPDLPVSLASFSPPPPPRPLIQAELGLTDRVAFASKYSYNACLQAINGVCVCVCVH